MNVKVGGESMSRTGGGGGGSRSGNWYINLRSIYKSAFNGMRFIG